MSNLDILNNMLKKKNIEQQPEKIENNTSILKPEISIQPSVLNPINRRTEKIDFRIDSKYSHLNGDYNSGYDKYLKKLEDLYNAVDFKFYFVDDNDYIFQYVNYPYRLKAASDFCNESQVKSKKVDTLNKNVFYNHLILDSGIYYPDMSNEVVLQIANKLKPEIIVPKDFLFDNKKTIESINNFLEIKDSYLDYDAKILIPLQKPYEIDDRFKKFDYFGIGGIAIKDISFKEKLKIITKVVNTYPNKDFHLFGINPSSYIQCIKQNKNIISSDCALIQTAARSPETQLGQMSSLSRSQYTLFLLMGILVDILNYDESIEQHEIF